MTTAQIRAITGLAAQLALLTQQVDAVQATLVDLNSHIALAIEEAQPNKPVAPRQQAPERPYKLDREQLKHLNDPLRLLRAKDLAALLKVHIVTVHRWAKSGRLPAPVRLGRKVTAWRAGDIAKYLEEHQAG